MEPEAGWVLHQTWPHVSDGESGIRFAGELARHLQRPRQLPQPFVRDYQHRFLCRAWPDRLADRNPSTQYSVAVREATLPNGVDTSQSASGLGDIWLGGRVRLLPDGGSVVGAVTLGLKLPTGSPNQEIPLGTGVIDYEGAVAFGGPFALAELLGYWQSSGGYRLRNRGANELTYQAEIGVTIAETLMLQGVVDGVHSFADFDAATSAIGGMVSTASSDQSFARWNANFIYSLSPDTDLTVGYGHTFSGRNALSAGAFGVGVAWKK